MKHIQTLNTRDMAKSLQNGGCGECQTSCQSACKTSCGGGESLAPSARLPYTCRADASIDPCTVGADSISARGRPPHCTITKRRKP